MGTTTPLGKPATRARIQNRQLAFRLDASQARQDSNLQPTVPKTVVLPIAPLAYTMRPMRPRWSRFARPITRWTPSAGAGGDGHCPPVRHHAPLGLPRQGGCRGEPATWIPMPADVHAWRGAYPYVPPVGFEPATGRVETACSDPLSYRGNLFPPERMSTTTRGERAGMPDSFSPAAPRYGA